ncbi:MULTISPECIES: DUF3073 domain-containing protein [Sciscionella]|uniref:DUF3073 domain-containing protein n=1 Tax=Sciscionella TaxID=596495 RepID=UPI0004765EFD|nr:MULTISPECIES: DUF3073 domain-containing protein [Sciscionella]
MGRGRAKAKQTKVARELKYNSGPDTDLDALQRELSSSKSTQDDDAYEDKYGDPYDDYDYRR